MSRVATNFPMSRYSNGVGLTSKPSLTRSSSNSSAINHVNNGNSNERGVVVRSAAPPPAQKETVHACPLCNSEYKDPRVLPCTHTYCLNCIRDKLINNNRVICPKCHHEVEPFSESDLNGLPRNIILSQEWRLSVRPTPSVPTSKKPVTYKPSIPPSTQMSTQQDKRKSIQSEHGRRDSSVNGAKSGIAATIANVFTKSSGTDSARSSRSASVASTQQNVSELVKIYSEATKPKSQKARSDSVGSTGKYDELAKIVEQSRNHTQRQTTPTVSSSIKQTSHAREEAYEEIAWDNVPNGTTPVAPPLPTEWQKATEYRHHPPEATERPISASSSDQRSHSENQDESLSNHQPHGEKNSPLLLEQPPTSSQIYSRPGTTFHVEQRSDEDDDNDVEVDADDDDDSNHTPQQQQQPLYSIVMPRPPSRQGSYANSIRSEASNSLSKHSPVPTNANNNQQRSSIIPSNKQQDEKLIQQTPSVASSSRRSSDRFPPPPKTNEILNIVVDRINQPRSPSALSPSSSIASEAREKSPLNKLNLFSTENVNQDTNKTPSFRANNAANTNSQRSSRASTPVNRGRSDFIEKESHYLAPVPSISSPTTTNTVKLRVDALLSDQKRLEHEIEEQIRRLQFDYDDVRRQIERKESSIKHEVRKISSRLDEDITEHYHRKRKRFAGLAADTNVVGTELERLKSTATTANNNNKNQLWANLEQIEINMRKIRQAVEEEKESRTALTFSEGHRAIASDTIGQLTYHHPESTRRFNTPSPASRPPPPPPVSSSSHRTEQLSTSITPHKYIKIDHLATLEPEAIAITENNKKILLGICNKLFILNDSGELLKTMQLTPSIRGIALSKRNQARNIAYISHEETVSMIDIDNGQVIDSVKETDSSGESGTFLPLGIDTDNVRGDVYVCDYRNSCVIKFDSNLEFISQWRIYNHSDQYDEARPKLVSVYGQKLFMIIEHSCKPYHNQGIAYTFSLHICDSNSGNIIKIIDADLLGTQRLRWPCSIQALSNDRCFILDTMTSGKYFNGQWQKHWSRVLEIGQDDNRVVTELFQLDSEAATMAMTKQMMIIAANGDILYVDLHFLKQQNNRNEHEYQNIP